LWSRKLAIWQCLDDIFERLVEGRGKVEGCEEEAIGEFFVV